MQHVTLPRLGRRDVDSAFDLLVALVLGVLYFIAEYEYLWTYGHG